MRTWLEKMLKKIIYKIDRKYANSRKRTGTFSSLSSPSIYGLYLLRFIIASFKNLKFKQEQQLEGTNEQASVLKLLGHSYYPGKLGKKTSLDLQNPVHFESKDSPTLTIIIHSVKEIQSLSQVLNSLQSSWTNEIKIIVVLEESQKDIISFLKENAYDIGIHFLQSKGKLIFALNELISSTNSDLIAFWNGKTILESGSLQELVQNMKSNPDWAAISGKTLAEDGLIKSAGSYINPDFELTSYGKFDLPTHPKYNLIREIDALDEVFAMFKVKELQAQNGLNENFRSLPHAFTDLVLRIKMKAGKKTIYTPLLTFSSKEKTGTAETISIGTNLLKTSYPKYFDKIELNKEEELVRRFLPKKTILFIDIFLPEYDKDSGSVRALHLLKMLKRLGYHVIFVPRKGDKNEPYYTQFRNLGIEILYAYPDRSGMKKLLLNILPSVDIAWICRPQLNQEFEWIFKQNPKIKWIYDTIDLHYIRLSREAELTGSQKLKRKANKFHQLELDLASKADVSFTVTSEEKNLLKKQSIKQVEVIPNIHEVHPSATSKGFSEREGLLFIGSYNHPPNIDAVVWMIEEIMPIIWKEYAIPVTLLGSAPTEKVKALASNLVKVPGFVQDVEPYFVNQRLFVAPLRYGAGMKGKIGQSLAYQLPIITTDIGAEGMGLKDGENVMLADNKENFAAQILKAYYDEILWKKLSNNSAKVLEPFTPEVIEKELAKVLESLN
ncbi:glycosyltransferase [Echinicola shivajiensis]|uniref:glycosyltransferase n=1 Tax=Echinicola shivajiensis TaxID=1035916 RepID=UPI001BFC23C3|nr:glycosyltransferase [Echinicola shivajiensis]